MSKKPDTETVAQKLARFNKKGPFLPFLKPETEVPDEEQLEEWVMDSVVEATDGCNVEPDGYCEHGHVSWLVYLGMM